MLFKLYHCVYFQKEPGNDNRGMRYRHFRAKHWYFLRFNCLKTFIKFCFLGIFAFPKVRRLLEDESIRELACQRLNLGLIVRYGEDEFIQTSVRFSLIFSKKKANECFIFKRITKAQYRGYLKLLQACIQGLEASFNTPGSNGLASAFHVLEIACTHFWASSDHHLVSFYIFLIVLKGDKN